MALIAAVCLLASGCSPGADYPTLFPAVHDMPPPRADTPMDPDQVQQATEDLITQRNHLTGQAQGSGQSTGQVNTPAPKSKPSAAGAANGANSATTGGTQGAAADAAQAAGTETK
jgi:hypothetical protein